MLFEASGCLEGRLLFPPASIVGIDAWVDGRFQAIPRENCTFSGIDDDGGATRKGGRIRLASRGLPFLTRGEIVRPHGSPLSYPATRDGKAALLFSEDGFFHRSAVRVSYTHVDAWDGLIPGPVDGRLPRARATVRGAGKAVLDMLVLGDSISTGCDCSAKIGLSPHEPSYVDTLARVVGCAAPEVHVRVNNVSEGGRDSRWGAKRLASLEGGRWRRAVPRSPPGVDLAIIAWGANDAAGRRSPREYARHVQAQVKSLARHHDAEIILVASSLMNEAWSGGNNTLLHAYRNELHGIARASEPTVAVADMTLLWSQLLERKDYYDMTGNGLNHPNDWGHRMHASVLAGLLGIT